MRARLDHARMRTPAANGIATILSQRFQNTVAGVPHASVRPRRTAVHTMRSFQMKELLRAFALLLVCSATSFAQGVQTGTIRGTVKDQQGLALPGATITATSPALQGERTVVTDTDGAYLFRAIPPGTYNLKVEMSGMAAVQKTA